MARELEWVVYKLGVVVHELELDVQVTVEVMQARSDESHLYKVPWVVYE